MSSRSTYCLILSLRVVLLAALSSASRSLCGSSAECRRARRANRPILERGRQQWSDSLPVFGYPSLLYLLRRCYNMMTMYEFRQLDPVEYMQVEVNFENDVEVKGRSEGSGSRSTASECSKDTAILLSVISRNLILLLGFLFGPDVAQRHQPRRRRTQPNEFTTRWSGIFRAQKSDG